jgi:coenzyme F420-0:L-glutamate ligase/coenzyme F420-1:gamma-L-glutamate ligase
VRGRADLVLAPGEDGPGAGALVRAEGGDLFGWGAREAVVRALRADPADLAPFGTPVPATDLAALVTDVLDLPAEPDGPADVVRVSCPAALARGLAALAFAHGWLLEVGDAPNDALLRRARP